MSTKKEKEQEATQGTADTGETQGTTTPTATEAAEKEAQAIIDAAKAEAAKIVEEAKAKAEANKTATQGTVAQAAPTGPKMVKIRLFKDNDKYKDDVFVAVNGRSYQIKRGVEVEVPDFVAEVLERSMKQDQATANMIERESGAYAAEAQRRGI